MKNHKNAKHFFTKPVMLVLFLIGVILITGYFLSGFKINFHVLSEKTVTQSETILTRIKEIDAFSTVEYVYKSVFPFDFYDESTDWDALLKKEANNEKISAKEQDELLLFNLCRSVGIHLNHHNYQFIVITSLIKAGLTSVKTLTQDDISINRNGVFIHLPKPEITEFIFEDPDSSSYNYPDVNIDPLQWMKITRFVKDKIISHVLAKGILNEADTRLKEFISSIIQQAGFNSVVFTQ